MTTARIRKIAVVGAGLMGHGIAQEFALAGYRVALQDAVPEQLERARDAIRRNLEMLARFGVRLRAKPDTVMRRIRLGTDLAAAVADADLVIEAVFEDLRLKRRIFRDLDRLCPPHTILASNTSTFPPAKLAAATQRADKVLVAHYFNPPHLLPLVEIVPGRRTSAATVTAVHDLLVALGKTPVVVRKPVAGFIGNRLQQALLREALSIVRQGIATPQDVDIVIRNGFGRRLAAAGVFEVFEIAGWDLVSAVTRNLLPHLESSTEVPALLTDKVRRGELGFKTGKGFYTWTDASAEALRQRLARTLVEVHRLLDNSR